MQSKDYLKAEESYYVLVNNKDEVYKDSDYTGSTWTVEFNTWEDADTELSYLLDVNGLDKKDGWHVENRKT